MSDRGSDAWTADLTDDGWSPDEGDPDMGDVVDELEELEDTVADPETRARVAAVSQMASRVSSPVFGRVIKGYDRADAAEAFLGSLLFGIPMLVEGGTGEVGAYIATHPIYLVFTLVLALVVVWGVLYVTDIQDVRIHRPIFGLVPRRFAGVLAIAFATAVVLMTAWGRVDWAEPWLAINSIVVTFVPMAIGGALGDILPGS